MTFGLGSWPCRVCLRSFEVLDDADVRIGRTLFDEARGRQAHDLHPDGVAFVTPNRQQIVPLAVLPCFHHNRGMGLVLRVGFGELKAEIRSASIVLDNVADVRCIGAEFKPAKESRLGGGVFNRPIDKNRVGRRKFELVRCRSGRFHAPRNEHRRPCGSYTRKRQADPLPITLDLSAQLRVAFVL